MCWELAAYRICPSNYYYYFLWTISFGGRSNVSKEWRDIMKSTHTNVTRNFISFPVWFCSISASSSIPVHIVWISETACALHAKIAYELRLKNKNLHANLFLFVRWVFNAQQSDWHNDSSLSRRQKVWQQIRKLTEMMEKVKLKFAMESGTTLIHRSLQHEYLFFFKLTSVCGPTIT